MASVNRVLIAGNLTRDPDIRYTPKGSAVADISLALNRTYTNDAGEKMEDVVYVDVVLWAKLAELAGQYLHKGKAVFIEGRLQLDSWEDKATGQKRTRLRVVGENMQFLGGKDAPQEGQPAAQSPAPRTAPAQQGSGQGWGGLPSGAKAPPPKRDLRLNRPPDTLPVDDDEDDKIPF